LRLVDRWFSTAFLNVFISAFIALDSSYYKVARKLHYKVRTVQRYGPFYLVAAGAMSDPGVGSFTTLAAWKSGIFF
jgi:hypothetical protein